MKNSIYLFLGMMIVSTAAWAGGEHAYQPYTGSAAFEKLKGLEGKWTGTVTEGGQTEAKPAVVTYEVTSGKSAVVEKLFPGTPEEMVSMYNDENGKLVMTHYCMLHNQPKLNLVSSDDNHISLQMTEEANGVKKTDPHMDSLNITFNGKDEITQEWRGYEAGKMSDKPAIFKLKRAAS